MGIECDEEDGSTIVAVRVRRVAVGLSTCRRGSPGTNGTMKAF